MSSHLHNVNSTSETISAGLFTFLTNSIQINGYCCVRIYQFGLFFISKHSMQACPHRISIQLVILELFSSQCVYWFVEKFNSALLGFVVLLPGFPSVAKTLQWVLPSDILLEGSSHDSLWVGLELELLLAA